MLKTSLKTTDTISIYAYNVVMKYIDIYRFVDSASIRLHINIRILSSDPDDIIYRGRRGRDRMVIGA